MKSKYSAKEIFQIVMESFTGNEAHSLGFAPKVNLAPKIVNLHLKPVYKWLLGVKPNPRVTINIDRPYSL